MLLHNIRNQLYSDTASHLKKQNPHVQFNNIQQNSRKQSHKFTHDNGHYPKRKYTTCHILDMYIHLCTPTESRKFWHWKCTMLQEMTTILII